MSKRRDKKTQFLARESGAMWPLSGDLAYCAFFELHLALNERRQPVYRTPTNHYTIHALGSILLLVAALEAWLNEAISFFGFMNQDLKYLAFKPIGSKYYEIPKLVADTEIPPRTELDLVIELRNEIAHFLPRVIKEEGNVPEWFVELHRRRLFITSSKSDVDFTFSQKLGSYRLAYWAWESVASAVADLLDALGPEAERIRWSASNFGHYRSICSPSELDAYDTEYKLELTKKK